MQRRLSLISTVTPLAGMQRASELFRSTPEVLWISQQNPTVNTSSLCLPAAKARTVLGREFYLVVFDAWSGLDVNALAAVTGAIRAGGALVLLTPPLGDWPQYPDPDCQRFLPYPWQPGQVAGHFIQRFIRMLANAGDLFIDPARIPATPSGFETRTTVDQQHALSIIHRTEHPVVLNADRGRGKSAVLGMLAKKFNADGLRVVLTAPSRATVVSVLQHAEYNVVFHAPDDLLRITPQADVLLVDEAAAIPLPMLLKMLERYPRCVFATTLQGYEGSGRGFVLRFQRELERLYPYWQDVKLNTPIRWQQDDGLESFLNQCLMMDSRADTPVHGVSKSDLQYKVISQSELVDNESKLREVFGLLVNAHYQTRPSDLRQMLDAPHITLHTLEWQQQTVAVALLAREGELSPELTAEIHAGKRRPHGHLLAQSLTFHAGIPQAACLHGERIMRIAVSPALQRQGLGCLLLGKLQGYAKQAQADYLGVSYALSAGLLPFWENAGFNTVRLGYRKDKASGSRSLMQVQGLSPAGMELALQAGERFQQTLPTLLAKLGDVPAELAAALKKPART